METTAGIIARIKSDLALLESILTKDTIVLSDLQVFEPNVEYKVGQIGNINHIPCKITECEKCEGCIFYTEDCTNYLCTPYRGRKDKASIIFKPI